MTKPETQLTLQQIHNKVSEIVRWNSWTLSNDEATKELMTVFTQALTSLKTEMEKKKKDEELTGMGRYYRGKAEAHNMAISECQRLLEGLK